MAISGVGQSYYQNNVATTKSTKSVNSMGETGNTKELSEAEEMAIFKKEFYDELSRINNHRTVSNMAINISEDAFKKMKEDPQYKQQILNLVQRDWGDSYAPRNCSVMITVGSSLNDYRADSWPVGYDSEFDIRSKIVFIKRQATRKIDKKSFWKNIWKNGRRLKNSSRKC